MSILKLDRKSIKFDDCTKYHYIRDGKSQFTQMKMKIVGGIDLSDREGPIIDAMFLPCHDSGRAFLEAFPLAFLIWMIRRANRNKSHFFEWN